MKTTFIVSSVLIAQIHLLAAGPATESGEFVAHEWGTFTSVQGGDGKLMRWNPLLTTELPSFVYNRTQPRRDSQVRLDEGKDAFLALQRMETPVIYFYGTSPTAVDVTVRFPNGLITEWYPAAATIGPSWGVASSSAVPAQTTGLTKDGENLPVLEPAKFVNQSLIRWSNLRLLTDGAKEKRVLPSESSGSHYYAARATDAAVVQCPPTLGNKQGEQEKFLFYRGLGSFATPLEVSLSGGGEEYLNLQNNGSEDLHHLFILNVKDGKGTLLYRANLAAGQSEAVRLKKTGSEVPISRLADAISFQMQGALEKEGLYTREAAAMVQTWRDTWFDEQGLRVLYVLPRTWTDRTLPLSVAPTPHDIVRVMVGRAEIITPRQEWEVLKQIVGFSQADAKGKADAIEAFRNLGLGRFAEPAVRWLVERNMSQDLSRAAWDLLMASRTVDRAGKHVALNH